MGCFLGYTFESGADAIFIARSQDFLMGRIVLFKGTFAYNAINAYVDGLAEGFQRCDRETVIVDLSGSDPDRRAIDALSAPCDFALGFDAAGSDIAIDGQSVYDKFGVLYVSAMLDHPAYYFNMLGNLPKKVIVGFSDRSHVSFVKGYAGDKADYAFLPHGGCGSIEAMPPPIDSKDRDIDVLFVGTFIDYERAREDWLKLPRPLGAVFEGILDCMLADETRGLEEAARHVIEGLGFYPRGEEFHRFSNSLHLVDRFVRGYRRRQCVGILARSGLRVDCFGNWAGAKLDVGRKFNIRGPVDITETLRLVRRSRIVVNVLPGYTDGAHERVFTGMLGGAVCVSDRSRYMEEEFVDGSDILLFSHRNSGVLPEALGSLLANPRKIREMAQSGRTKVIRSHTWVERAKRLLVLTEMSKFFRMDRRDVGAPAHDDTGVMNYGF